MDEPQDHKVGRDAQEHVDKLEAQVPNEDHGHVSASLVHRLLSSAGVEGPEGDEERRGVWVENIHDQIRGVIREVRSGRTETTDGGDDPQKSRCEEAD